MIAKFTILGEPRGKERPRVVRSKNGVSHAYTDSKTTLYENIVKTEYRSQCRGIRFPQGAMLDVRIKAYFAIPKSATKERKRMMEIGAIRPTKTPDWDNIGKIICDSINHIAYKDDAWVVDGQVRKFYSRRPRVEVSIRIANNGKGIKHE